MRALAMYLRNDIGISYRKVPRALGGDVRILVCARILDRV